MGGAPEHAQCRRALAAQARLIRALRAGEWEPREPPARNPHTEGRGRPPPPPPRLASLVWKQRASAAGIWGGGPECTASGVPREPCWPGDPAFPQISAPARPPRPLFPPSPQHLLKSICEHGLTRLTGAACTVWSLRAKRTVAERPPTFETTHPPR